MLVGNSSNKHGKRKTPSTSSTAASSRGSSTKKPAKTSKQQAKDAKVAKAAAKKQKKLSFSSNKGKKPFVKGKHVNDPITDKDMFEALYPNGWELNPAHDETNPKSHEYMVPCTDPKCDKITFSHSDTRYDIFLFICICNHVDY